MFLRKKKNRHFRLICFINLWSILINNAYRYSKQLKCNMKEPECLFFQNCQTVDTCSAVSQLFSTARTLMFFSDYRAKTKTFLLENKHTIMIE